ncbi:MAG: hypothetical protein NT079_00725 [Candidatus Omnitrophica bacterium]|nr:hypothetical protein [Candidatus Omnitrophota bacterium]
MMQRITINILRKTSSRGLTLPELILAAAILAFTLSGLVALFVNCSVLNEASRNLSVATSHADFIMETIKNTAFASIKTSINAGTWTLGNPATINGLPALRNESITTTWIGTRPLEVTVTIAWKDKTNRNRTFLLGSVFQ